MPFPKKWIWQNIACLSRFYRLDRIKKCLHFLKKMANWGKRSAKTKPERIRTIRSGFCNFTQKDVLKLQLRNLQQFAAQHLSLALPDNDAILPAQAIGLAREERVRLESHVFL